MQEIVELTVLSRVTVKLPEDLMIATKNFQEGWNFIQSGDVHWLDKRIRQHGWHFLWIGEPSLRSGVGATAQAAIAGALKLALRRINPSHNTANIEHVEIVEYPWFFLAKVRVCPYQIQQNAILQMSDGAMPPPMAAPTGLISVAGSTGVPAIQ